MKTTGFLTIALTLLLSAPQALADVFVYPAAYQDYAAQGESQVIQPSQIQHSPTPSQPCACANQCAQPIYIIQQPPPPPRTVIAQEDRTVYFDFNKANLDNDAKEKLNSLAGRLMSADDVTGTMITGYADRIGSVKYNEALSQKRAENVRSYLIDRGFIKPSPTETRWVGKSQPSTQCSKYLPRDQLLRCLQPDRKVEVNINYRTQVPPKPVD